MGVHDPGDPRRRRTAAGQGGDHVEVVAHPETEPAVAGALNHFERPGLLERLDVLLGLLISSFTDMDVADVTLFVDQI